MNRTVVHSTGLRKKQSFESASVNYLTMQTSLGSDMMNAICIGAVSGVVRFEVPWSEFSSCSLPYY